MLHLNSSNWVNMGRDRLHFSMMRVWTLIYHCSVRKLVSLMFTYTQRSSAFT
nr:MAG TPA: hypothetical protein [Caudoviricetes sp.]